MADNKQHIRKWLIDLGIRCAPTSGTEDVEVKLANYVQVLTEDFPQSTFTDACLNYVSKKFEFFPAYSALVKALEVWTKENKPVLISLPAGEDATLDPDDRMWVKMWMKRQDPLYESPVTPRFDLVLMRRYRPRAFAYLMAHDNQVAEIAVLNHWVGPQRGPKTDEERKAVTEMSRLAVEELAQVGYAKRAGPMYQKSHEVPREEPIRTIEAYTLPPEVLEAQRQDNPIVQKARETPVRWEDD